MVVWLVVLVGMGFAFPLLLVEDAGEEDDFDEEDLEFGVDALFVLLLDVVLVGESWESILVVSSFEEAFSVFLH